MISDVRNGFNNEFTGFRYANNSEISELWSNAGIDETFPFSTSIASEASYLADLLGSWTFTSASYRWGIVGFSDGNIINGNFRDYVQQPFIEYDIPSNTAIASFNRHERTDIPSTNWGHWLVSESNPMPVSEPSIIVLMGLGLVGLGFTARRKRLLVA
jgi:hypothetical protein